MALPKQSPQKTAQIQADTSLSLCSEILRNTQSELCLSFRFLDVAISELRLIPDPALSGQGNGLPFGTDGACFYYVPDSLFSAYRQSRILVNRTFLHSLLHCIFCHFTGRGSREKQLWNLSCDIAVEWISDSLAARNTAVRLHGQPAKTAFYQRLLSDGTAQGMPRSLHAEAVYRILSRQNLSVQELLAASRLFTVDNHVLWESGEDAKANMQLSMKTKWQEVREKMQTALETGSRDPGDAKDPLLSPLRAANRERYDYRSFLRKFSVLREELKTDPDSFDPVFYTYGLSKYGNLPLIEPQETKEVRAVSEFVIAIDTSYSTSGDLVKKFLEETISILSERDSFFQKTRIHVIQCDDRIKEDRLIASAEDLESYLRDFRLIGQGGTDFRPVFSYVDSLLRRHEFKQLRGLVYFTDGKGIYPLKRPPYDTAFVFLDDDFDDFDVPPWAMKLIIQSDDLEPDSKRRTGT